MSLSRTSALALFAGLLILAQRGYAGTRSIQPDTLEIGFSQMYNLDFAGAHKTFKAWQELHPDDPLGAASNAAAYLFGEFERLHILELDVFTDDQRFKQLGELAPDPGVKAAFENEVAKANAIAARNLAESSDDRNALFARVLTDGLRGNYAALIEKRRSVGLELLKLSRTNAEKLIAMDPDYYDAYLAVGIENYILGLRSAPVRWILRASGAQTNKSKGVDSLKITAEKGRYLAPYARLLLAIAAIRDRDRDTARDILSALAHEFPQNHLYKTELSRLQSRDL